MTRFAKHHYLEQICKWSVSEGCSFRAINLIEGINIWSDDSKNRKMMHQKDKLGNLLLRVQFLMKVT